MNITYHYFVLKTLSRYAGFSEDDAQQIAHFSQQIDDYVLDSPLLLDEKPPEFFTKNGLAFELLNGLWLFFPHATGIGTIRCVAEKYQRNTIVPFHFIPTKTFSEIEAVKAPDRGAYRCVEATSRDAVLINTLIADITGRAQASHDKKTLMEFGMLLHTYADTFAHCHFSGLHGWENNAYVKEAYDTYRNAEGMHELEILFFKALPSIGHANVGHAPDVCSYRITLALRKSKSGAMNQLVQRDNMTFFAQCSRNLLGFLCKANGKSVTSNDAWETLQRRLATAETVPNEEDIPALEAHWKQVFPEYEYHYRKEDKFALNISEDGVSGAMLTRLNVSQEDITDLYSEKGNQARHGFMLIASNADQAFFDYNELAYRRTMKVAGEYGVLMTQDELRLFANAAKRFAPATAV